MEDLAERVARRFSRAEPRNRLYAYLSGLLSGPARKNGASLAQFAGETSPCGMQRLLRTAGWDADAVRDDMRDHLAERIGDENGVLVISEAAFVKRGDRSVGVARQYVAATGRTENCQLGMFVGYVTDRGKALIDRELYLPEFWIDDESRRLAAGIGPEVRFAARPSIARQMLTRVLETGVPAGWIAAGDPDSVNDSLRTWIDKRRIRYVVAVAPEDPALVTENRRRSLAGIAAQLPPQAWRCEGYTAADRAEEWGVVPLSPVGNWPRTLLLNRSIADPHQVSGYLCSAPGRMTRRDFVGVVRAQRTVDAALREARRTVGLDSYQARTFTAWYRHMTLAMFAYNALAIGVRTDRRGPGRAPVRPSDPIATPVGAGLVR